MWINGNFRLFHEQDSLVHNLESSVVLLDKSQLNHVLPPEIHMWAMSLCYFTISSMSSVQFSFGYGAVTLIKALTFKLANEVECATLITQALLSFLPTIRDRKTSGKREYFSLNKRGDRAELKLFRTIWCLRAVMQRLIH